MLDEDGHSLPEISRVKGSAMERESRSSEKKRRCEVECVRTEVVHPLSP